MFHKHASAAESEQQNSSNSMWKLARDLNVGPLDCVRYALHTEHNFIFGHFYMKILKHTATFSS